MEDSAAAVVEGLGDETRGRVSNFIDEVDSAHILGWGGRKEGDLLREKLLHPTSPLLTPLY